MKGAKPKLSLRCICRVLNVNRSTLHRVSKGEPVKRKTRDVSMQTRIKELAREHPTFGYRRLWALLRHGDGLVVNLKKVHRLVKSLRLQVKSREVTPRPRVQSSVSRCECQVHFLV